MKSTLHLSSLSKIAIFLLLLTMFQCQEQEFGRKLLVTTKIYDGEKVIDPTFSGEIIDMGSSPIVHHGFIWGEEDNPDITAANNRDIGARTEIGVFSAVMNDLTQNTIYFVRAYATDENGETVYGKIIQYKTPQQTTPLSANEGGAGTIIIILGTFSFTNIIEITVKFGEIPGTVAVAAKDNLQVVVPQSTPGTVKISITIAGVTQFIPDDFTILKEPVIESVSPKSGAVGSTMTLRGINFITTPYYNTVFFDTIPSRVISATSTELVTTVPEGLPLGNTPVSVKSGGLKSLLSKEFKISSIPSVKDYLPKTGAVGVRVIITGKNFSSILSDTKVKFGTVVAEVASVSDSTISAIVPNELNIGATVPITVTTNGKEFKLTPDFIVKNASDGSVAVAASISNPTVWAKVMGPGEVDYRITQSITVSQELTLAPGVIVEFDNGKSMTISGTNSALIAKGTATSPIVFTGKEKVKGSWDKINFSNSTSSKNELAYVEVSYGGSANYLVDVGTASLKVSNSTFTNSKNAGVNISTSATLGSFANNTFANNGLSPLRIAAGQVGKLESNNKFTGGNGRNVVEVIGSTLNNFEETVWRTFNDGSPYYVSGNVTVTSGMKVMPGAVVTFNLNISLTISGAAAYLSAKGISTNKITFTGADRSFKGSWDKIFFTGTLSPKNEFDQVEITHGGSNISNRYNLQLNNSNLKISNTVISNSAGGGMYADDGSTFETSFNTFSNNNTYPIYVTAKHINGLDVNTIFVGNTINKVFVSGSTLNDVNNEHVWKPLDNNIPYFFNGNIFIYSGLRILPGTVLTFNSGTYMQVTAYNATGYITAKGTASQKIIFTGADSSIKGSWRGLEINNTTNPKNELDFVEISRGGSTGNVSRSNLILNYNATLKLTNSTISNSASDGIMVENGSDFSSFANNSFTDNTSYPLNLQVYSVGKLDAASTFTGNVFNKVRVNSGTLNDVTMEHVWINLGGGTSYYFPGDVTINSGLSILPGATLEFNTDARLLIQGSAAYLTAKGTMSSKITFTGAVKAKGSWENIYFNSSNLKNELDHVLVEYAGTNSILVWDNSRPKITNSTNSPFIGSGIVCSKWLGVRPLNILK